MKRAGFCAKNQLGFQRFERGCSGDETLTATTFKKVTGNANNNE